MTVTSDQIAAAIKGLASGEAGALAAVLTSLAGGGGSRRTIACPFAYNTPNLLTGAILYTPTVGDILHNAWIEIEAAWNGTSPKGDVGIALNDTWFVNLSGSYVDMAYHDLSGTPANDLLAGGITAEGTFSNLDLFETQLISEMSRISLVGFASAAFSRFVPAKFIEATPVKAYVANGGPGGADPGSTQGAAVLYLDISTPQSA